MSMSKRKDQHFIVPHRSTEMFRRMLKKDGEGSLDGPFRSQSAHDQNVLPRCARIGTNPGYPFESE